MDSGQLHTATVAATHWPGGWVGTKTSPDDLEKKKFSFSNRELTITRCGIQKWKQ
jgi:hypothetical protein